MELEIPTATLLIDLSTNNPAVYSGKKLNRMINGVAGGLHNLNLPPGASVGLLGLNSAAFVAAMIGMHNTNCICVPINYKLPKDKVDFCIKDSNVVLVFCDPAFRHLVPEGVTVVEFGQEFDKFIDNDFSAPTELDPDRLCIALYTSGTTGTPKKILFSYNDRFSETMRNKILSYGLPDTKTLSANPLFHNAGINWLTANLLRGNTIFLPSKFDAKECLRIIEKHKITSLSLVPPMMSMMLNETEILKTLNTDSVREIIFQAALADKFLIERTKKVFTKLVYMANPYGLTETGSAIFGLHPDGIPVPLGSAGYPMQLVRTKLVDNVLHVKTEDLLSRLSENNEEYFNTRDRFQVDEQGFYYYIGRADDMLKCGGEKVFPIEVEAVLNQHPCVLDSVVIGLEDEIKGQKPYAFVKVSAPVDETELIKYVADNLASYQIPKRIWQLDNFPINEIGKTDKKNLKHLATQYILNKG